MTEFELTNAIAHKLNTSFADANKSLQAILNTMSEELVKGENIKLLGFGTFEIANRAPRKGFNPYYRKEVVIPACKEPVFKPGKDLKELIKNS